jgi:thymidylate synthase (FAD)
LEKGYTIKCLDHGFVRLVDFMGDDSSIVQSARVSYGAGTKSVREDRALIRHLMRHRHTSPFEMGEIKVHMKLPIVVARQIIRHRTANVNELSGRYSVIPEECYIPAPENLKGQDSVNKQGSSGVLDPVVSARIIGCMEGEQKGVYANYKSYLKDGLSKESSRIDLPLSTYTEWYWKCDLHNIFNFLRLRLDSHAQYEARVYAEALAEIVKALFPVSYEAFEDYVLNAVTFSKQELEVLGRMLNKSTRVILPTEVSLSATETAEFEKKIDKICS